MIQDFVSDWVWGQFSNDHVGVVFFQILTQSGQLIERVAMINSGWRFTGTALETNYLNTLFQANRPDEFDSSARVSFLNQYFQLEFDISPLSLMRSRIDEEHNGNLASYLRWSATATFQGGCGPQSLRGISEYIRIRPPMYGSLSKSKHR